MPIRYGVFSCDIYEYPKGDMVCYKDYEDLDQENAKLKRQLELDYGILKTYEVRAVKAEAKLHNIEEGLEKLGKLISNDFYRLIPYHCDSGVHMHIYDNPTCFDDDNLVYSAPNLAELIVKIGKEE